MSNKGGIMLTEEKIQELKEKHGRVLAINIGGKDYVYKPLLRKDYERLQSEALAELKEKEVLSPTMEAEYEEKMVKECVVYPEDFANINFAEEGAGLIPSLAAYIYVASGFNTQVEPVEL